MEKTKKSVSYTIDEKLNDAFIVTAKFMNERMSNVIEKAMYDYCRKNKAVVSEKVKDYRVDYSNVLEGYTIKN